jgi:hypothetical protein
MRMFESWYETSLRSTESGPRPASSRLTRLTNSTYWFFHRTLHAQWGNGEFLKISVDDEENSVQYLKWMVYRERQPYFLETGMQVTQRLL